MKRLSLICLLVLLVALPALGEEAARKPVAENEFLQLFVTDDLAGIEVLDKSTGVLWSSSMNDETFDGKVNAQWQKKMESLLVVNYTNLLQGLGVINNAALLADKEYAAEVEPIENGVRLRYTLGLCKIKVCVEVTLDGDSLVLRVPYDGIEEYGDFSLVSIDMLPFLCSASDNAEGYFLYPDGSGAIMEFKDNAHINESTQMFTLYGNLEKQKSLLDMFDQEEPAAMLPVFGMNRGSGGVLVIIEEGDETARISLNCSNKIVKINYLFANFQYRRGFDDKRVTSRSIKTYDRKAMQTDYVMRVLFLPEGRTDYSGMACAYRDYLLAKGDLTRQETPPRMALDLFLATKEDGLLFDLPRTVTTLPQAGEILDALYAEGIRDLQVTLKGWSQDGWGSEPDQFPLSGGIGSEKDLKALIAKAEGYGYTLSLAANLMEAKADQSSYSKRNDVVFLGNFTILTDHKETVFMLSADVVAEKYQLFEKKAVQLGIHGVRLERMGQMTGYNYNANRYITTAETLDYYRQMLQDAGNNLGVVTAEGGAAWLLPYVEQVTGIPYAGHGFQFTTKSVPFYQMVVHGLVEYTATPGNLSSDLQREVLRWVEMGYMPYFELTYLSTEELMYTAYQSLFTAQYGAWLDRVSAIAHLFAEGDLAALHSAVMLRHEQLNTDLYKVTYDNGMQVYVNYAKDDVKADGITVPAMDYRIVKEGQQ